MIDHLIPVSALELIRNKIASILMCEYKNQYIQHGNVICNEVVFIQERTIPIDKTELDMIEISLFKGDDSDNSYQGGQHKTYTFALEITTKSKTTESKKGYKSSSDKLQRHISLLRYILMNPQYATLCLTGVVERTTFSKFQIYKDDRMGDASNISNAQILFDVLCDEVSEGNEGFLLSQSDTDVLIGLTDRGYQYQLP